MRELNDKKIFAGVFYLDDEKHVGQIEYDCNNGSIILGLKLPVQTVGYPYHKSKRISGTLSDGWEVSLFDCTCIHNHTVMFNNQTIAFSAQYAIVSKKQTDETTRFDRLVFTVENALLWSKLSAIDAKEPGVVKITCGQEPVVREWFDSKIVFSTKIKSELFSFPMPEEAITEERLEISIETQSKENVSFFLAIQDKLLSLISFAIKDNVNILEQELFNTDDVYFFNEDKQESAPYEYSLLTRRRYNTVFQTRPFEYNFSLDQLATVDSQTIEKLMPVFDLYSVLLKIENLPKQIAFLSIVQALETFHARFFYHNDRNEYIQRVHDRFPKIESIEWMKQQLLSDQQIKNARNIVLLSRISDLLINADDGVFHMYYQIEPDFSRKVVDSRNYYTHYDEKKKAKAFSKEELIEATQVLILLLEHRVSLLLGVDNSNQIRLSLSAISYSKKIDQMRLREKEMQQ